MPVNILRIFLAHQHCTHYFSPREGLSTHLNEGSPYKTQSMSCQSLRICEIHQVRHARAARVDLINLDGDALASIVTPGAISRLGSHHNLTHSDASAP